MKGIEARTGMMVAERPARLNPVDRRLRDFARDQRGSMPRAEALFWQQVRAGRFRGLKFRRQAPIAPCIVDFLRVAARVVVELDGAPHEDETRRRRDAERDAWLAGQGFQVLRFPNDLVLSDLGAVLEAVGAAIDQRGCPPLKERNAKNPPPSAGEGAPRMRGGRGDRDISGQSSAPLSRPSLTRGPPSPAEGVGE